MNAPPPMSSRERIIRLTLGLGLIALGCAVFAASKAYDPANRAALIGIIAIVVGMTWTGQGIRGHVEGPVHREAHAPVGPPISADRTLLGIFLAWIVPGLGHWIIGRRGKALLYFTTITATFVAGVALAEGRNLSWERDAVYFLAYVFNLGETAIGWLFTHNLAKDHHIPNLHVGFLYTAVACLLNLVAMMDVIATCAHSAGGEPDEGGEHVLAAVSPEDAP